MGILDEAIRQHLELKRRQGAADDELKRLEDEAFGPPTRPGEPDFPEQQPEGGVEEDGGETDVDTETPAPEPAEASVAPSGLEESRETPAAEPIEDGGGVDQAMPDAAREEAPESVLDHVGEESFELGEIDLDLDQELDRVREIDEPEDAGLQAPDRAGSEEPPLPSPGEPPVESLDTVEHHVEEAFDQPAPAEEAVEEPAPEGAPEEPPPAEGEGDEGTEDVLEETPEFLQDAPEDDELWFEQGKPEGLRLLGRR